MMKDNAVNKRYIVDETILPEAILKTAQTKELLAKNPGLTINEAVKQIGLSRSAFYKYRDCISPFQNMMAGRIITFQMVLKDKAGVLSSILSIFANCGANILTINQSIPTGGKAMVTISAETGALNCPIEELTHVLAETRGVVRAEAVAG